jgi:hypothetical protein
MSTRTGFLAEALPVSLPAPLDLFTGGLERSGPGPSLIFTCTVGGYPQHPAIEPRSFGSLA